MPWTKKQLDRDRYESHLKAVRDDIARQEGAFQKGIREGMQQVMKARAEGETIGRIHALESLQDRPLTSAEELLAMPSAQLNRLTEQLQSEIRGRR